MVQAFLDFVKLTARYFIRYYEKQNKSYDLKLHVES